MITVSYNAYCAISKEGDNNIWAVRPRGVVLLLALCSQIDVGATVNALLGDTFSRENNTHGSRYHDRDPQFASRILGAMTQSCYIGTRDIRSRVIRCLYCNTIWVLIGLCKFWGPSCYIEYRGIRNRTIKGFYCIYNPCHKDAFVQISIGNVEWLLCYKGVS